MLQTLSSIPRGSKVILEFGRRPRIEGTLVSITAGGTLVLDSARVRRDLVRRAVVTIHFPEE